MHFDGLPKTFVKKNQGEIDTVPYILFWGQQKITKK